MDNFLDQDQVDVLKEVGEQFQLNKKINRPLVIDVLYSSASWLMAYLPLYLGKGTSKFKSKQGVSSLPTKPILIVANSVESLYGLQILFRDCVQSLKGIGKDNKKYRLSYDTYVMPTTLPRYKTAYDFDLILAGTYYYKYFSKSDFSAVVIFESDHLETSVLNDMINSFHNTFTVLVRTFYKVKQLEGVKKSLSRSCRLLEAELNYSKESEHGTRNGVAAAEKKVKQDDVEKVKAVNSGSVVDDLKDVPNNTPALCIADLTTTRNLQNNNEAEESDMSDHDPLSPSLHLLHSQSALGGQLHSNRVRIDKDILPTSHSNRVRIDKDILPTSSSIRCTPTTTGKSKHENSASSAAAQKCFPILLVLEVIRHKVKQSRCKGDQKGPSTSSNCGNNVKNWVKKLSQVKWKLQNFAVTLKNGMCKFTMMLKNKVNGRGLISSVKGCGRVAPSEWET